MSINQYSDKGIVDKEWIKNYKYNNMDDSEMFYAE